jgi:predicted esterase
MVRFALAAVVVACWGSAFGQTTRLSADAPSVEIRTVLARPPSSKPNGTVTQIDPVQAELADGTFAAPTAGEVWRKLDCAPDGHFESDVLEGGWAWATVDCDADRVMLLRASGHAMVYVDGEPRAGDVYSAGYLALPVKLHKGTNTFLFQAGRGRLTAKLEATKGPLVILPDDATLPDLVESSLESRDASVIVVNASEKPARIGLKASTNGDLGEPSATSDVAEVTWIPAMSARKVRVSISPATRLDPGEIPSHIFGQGIAPTDFKVRVRDPLDVRRCTFISGVDGSVQYYALRPASRVINDPATTEPAASALRQLDDLAIVLSLHGASVEATGQAGAYASKTWAHIVCPTNRRPYGLNWEEWGQTDALEVLADAERTLPHDPSRIYLTGHSMGGHGSWHLGTNLPGTFAAIAPSAGWVSFESYAPDRAATRPSADAPNAAILSAFRGASLASDTLAMKENLATSAVYILHGVGDDNVPVTEARTMVDALKTFHTDWRIHEQPGANHWWSTGDEPGARCVDWPGFFDLFAQRRLPADAEVRDVKFMTANPAICSKLHWAEILQQQQSGAYSRVDLHVDPFKRRFSGTTQNVSALALDTSVLAGEGVTHLDVDGDQFEVRRPGRLRLWRSQDGWRSGPAVPAGEKNPRRAGPVKSALGHRMIFVYGTKGTDEENRLNYVKAGFDAESWYYRANGAVDVLADTDESLAQDRDRTLVLYGNEDTNAAFRFLDPRCPVHVTRAQVTLAEKILPGDDTVIFCYPRANSAVASVVAIAPTSPRAARASYRLPIFVPGIGWPDYAVISADSLKVGDKGILAAGFFDQGWGL